MENSRDKPVVRDTPSSADLLENYLYRQRELELQEKQPVVNTRNQVLDHLKNEGVPYSKAKKSADSQKFISMVKNIVTKIFKDEKVELLPWEGPRIKIDPQERVDHPYIFFQVINRKPRNNEMKPKYREAVRSVDERGNKIRAGIVYGQTMDAIYQFDIVAGDYELAEQVMNKFEDAMLKYMAYFKAEGVSEMFFHQQFTDENLDVYRQIMSTRSLQYRVSLEKIFVSYDTTIS